MASYFRTSLYRRCFLADRRGVTAIEFALVFPILLLLTFGIIEFSLIMFASSVIENAATSVARLSMTGNTYSSGTRRDMIVAEILRTSKGLLDKDRITVEVSRFSDYVTLPEATKQIATLDLDNSTNTEAEFGVGNQPVIYDVRYEWQLLTPLGFLLNWPFNPSDPHKVLLQSTVLVKNERFS